MGPRASLDAVVKRKIPSPYREYFTVSGLKKQVPLNEVFSFSVNFPLFILMTPVFAKCVVT